MATSTNPSLNVERKEIWAEYQKHHDVSPYKDLAAGIEPVSGRVWFGESGLEIRDKMLAEGINAPFYCVRVRLRLLPPQGRAAVIRGIVDRKGVPYIEVALAGTDTARTIDTGFNGDSRVATFASLLGQRCGGYLRRNRHWRPGITVQEDVYAVEFPFDGRVIEAEATFADRDDSLDRHPFASRLSVVDQLRGSDRSPTTPPLSRHRFWTI